MAAIKSSNFSSHLSKYQISRMIFLHLILLAANNFVWAEDTPSQRLAAQYDANHYQKSTNSECLDRAGAAQRCVPDFVNSAFNLAVHVSRPEYTCGVARPSLYCIQTGSLNNSNQICSVCDNRNPEQAHPPVYLTDLHDSFQETWWQSTTMEEGIHRDKVNLTLVLGKAFDITYVSLKFAAPQPESFVIYKKTSADAQWEPWQFYSGSCRTTFGMAEKAPILPGNEAVARCTREFSDISPLTGGNIVFSTLEGRPSAEMFEESEVLQKWVTATEIMISLVRLNTFGDEIWGDQRVLRTYFYAITDFAVGGRCKCNGHANKCVKSTGQGDYQLVCDCQHHTAGVDCQQCAPFYLDRPWRPATSLEANECLPCNCNGLSNRCFFDAKLFEDTGHGGHCIDCAGNTQGTNCEECAPNHWRHPAERYCRPCQCNEAGSVDGQCNPADGQCQCKPGVGGQFCDKCLPGFFAFSSAGCKDCRCDRAGSFNNRPECSSDTGNCMCKENVEGQHCDKCKPGYFQLSGINQFGCTPCFCFGHSSVCSAADDFYAVNLTSKFVEDVEEWMGASELRKEDVQWAQLDKAAAVSQIDQAPVYFYAPAKFLGDQRFAYNQFMQFTLRVQQAQPEPSQKDIVIVGANGRELVLPIFAQGNPLPSTTEQNFRFRLHAHPSMQWSPTLPEVDFIAVLANVSAIGIRGTYSKGDVAFLSNFTLGTASPMPANGALVVANWVEQCKCTDQYVGQFCESCSHGFKRELAFGGTLTKCIPCECNGHSESCDPESGVCICQHNTAGDKCEQCARGYFGDAMGGTSIDCKKCDCPDDGPCILMPDGDTFCTECPDNYAGRKCDVCAEESYGNPTEGIACKKCNCNGNTDANAIGKCDRMTGECKKCIYHTAGWNCELCAAGFWGNALAEHKGGNDHCKPCGCYAPGTRRPNQDYELLECRQADGQCDCQPNVVGQRCEQCARGFFNISSGIGCQPCGCDPLGSLEDDCDFVSGQCQCKPGVTGQKCDRCAPRHFGLNLDGCAQCNCDPIGSETLECDTITGQCLCHENVEGRKCAQCSENRFDMRHGCLQCDDCYALIQSRKNELNESTTVVRENLDEIRQHPVMTINDSDFDENVQKAKADVEAMHHRAEQKFDADDSMIRDQIESLKKQLNEAGQLVEDIQRNLRQIDTNSKGIERELSRFNADTEATQKELAIGINYVQTQGHQHLANAEQAAHRYGERSAKLSELAEEAKQLADKQEQKRQQILELSQQVQNASKQAINDATEAIFGGTAISQQIANLQQSVQEAEQRLKSTMELARQQSEEAHRALNVTAHTLSRVESVRLPKNILPSDAVIAGAEMVRKEAQMAVKSAKQQRENEQAKLLLEETAKMLEEVTTKLSTLTKKQSEIDHAVGELQKYSKRTEAAFDMATKTWNAAKDAHDALSDFHGKVSQSREEAANELANLPEISAEIDAATKMLAEGAEQAIGQTNLDASVAQSSAEESGLKAVALATDAEMVAEAAEQLEVKSAENGAILNEITADIDALILTTRDFENQANSDAQQSKEVAMKAAFTESASKGLQQNLTESEQKLLHFLAQLNSLENVDDAQLVELDNLLVDAERRFAATSNAAAIKERIRKAEADALLEKRQIDSLQMELENLRGIRDSLPTRCYNLINLEQEGQ